jgi:predicted dehydrogenase
LPVVLIATLPRAEIIDHVHETILIYHKSVVVIDAIMVRLVKFGVIGMGRMGLWHAKDFKSKVPGAELVAVSDIDKASAIRGSRELGVAWYQDYRKLWTMKDLDAVCVVTSTDTHAPISTEAAELGLHVFIEKPMATTTKDADRLRRAVRRTRVKLQVGFMRRFDPAYVHAKKRIEAGDIGKALVFKSISRDPFPPPPWACDPKRGGGLQIEMHAHDYDLGRWLMESEVDTVFTQAECLAFPEIKKKIPDFVDNTLITLSFVNKNLGSVEGSLNAKYGYDVRAEVYGTDGMITIGAFQRIPVVVYRSRGANLGPYFLGEDQTPHFAQRFGEAYLAEKIHFTKTIREDLRAKPSLEDGTAALNIGMAAFRSTGTKRPVKVAR